MARWRVSATMIAGGLKHCVAPEHKPAGHPQEHNSGRKFALEASSTRPAAVSSNRLALQILHQEAHFRDRSMLFMPQMML
ncbi:hypothetical protein ELI49_26455 (plasmid) [Rhizobium ruizarguesonis]|uniref:Uncharacterized protein n=1 Tax=Rhizobium ruizarguesonis TaxID=2081791 RepID=A0AAE8Q9R7_9HYPH|nr:hypothetical protein [Rhizobium leguminosarum bv. viciae]NKQ84834.1 hypothetical protein [Rhizobium ruizarguesonis]NKL26077.1 hypothetical protein [Rhizobium leguminosarum bv. viciae]NKL42378.1 hypothetical protein [Rhizobium leguminosarum bv. viciae]TAT73826.1 hypothetical protein ELI56_25225 [Rhizobium ruizarguesonis]